MKAKGGYVTTDIKDAIKGDDYINALGYKKYPLYDAIALISDSHPNMTVKEVRNIVNILIESGIVKDERPINAE